MTKEEIIGINEHKKAQEELNKIREEEQKQNKVFDAEKSANYKKFSDLQYTLNEKRRKTERILDKKIEKYRTKTKEKEKTHVEKISMYKRILTLMEIFKDQQDTDFKVYKYDYPRDKKGEVIRVQRGNCLDYPEEIEIPYEPIVTLKNDKYAKIQVFIVDNGKPKNKYSLLVVGSSIFPDSLFKERKPHYYLGWRSDCHTDFENIQLVIKDKPTKEELVAYFEKNKEKMLKDYLEEHQQIEKEYEETIRQTNNTEWELAYWENQKDYYENHYSHWTETDEYKKVLQKIRELGGIA